MGINAIARYDKDVVEVTVLGDDETLAKMSRDDDDDVEPYLYSRNTIGHGSHNSKSQRPKRVKIVIGGSDKRWWYAEVSVGTGVKLGETRQKWTRGWSCCCQGPDFRANGWMSGMPDVRWTRADVRAP